MRALNEKLTITVHTMLYILEKLGGKGNFHKLFKVLYFADQKHLTRYGSQISDDRYVAMKNGPVPSMAYDVLKALRGDGLLAAYKPQMDAYFELHGDYEVRSMQQPDMDELSETEIQCIDEAVAENKGLSFNKLTEKSHDKAWKKAKRDFDIEIKDIAAAGGANKYMLHYIKDISENQSAKP